MSVAARTQGDGVCRKLTLFPDQAVVAVVGVVGISRNSTSTITDDSEVEFWMLVSISWLCAVDVGKVRTQELMTEAARVTGAVASCQSLKGVCEGIIDGRGETY